MRTECAWCGQPISEPTPSFGAETSHGICSSCLSRMQAEVLRVSSSAQHAGRPQERRCGWRLPCALPAACRVPGTEDWFPAVVADLSAQGLRLLLDRPVAEGAAVEVGPAAGGWPVPRTGRVVWAAVRNPGGWQAGCVLPGPLTESELRQCLSPDRA